MRLCAVIVAGGASSRMGREKATTLVRGRMIMERIASGLVRQVDSIVINANGDWQRFSHHGLSVISDLRTDVGTPLAGVHAALVHAKAHGFDALLTVPSDEPFLPSDLASRLAAASSTAAIAASGGQQHYLTGLWSCALLPELEKAISLSHKPRVQDWARLCDVAIVEWPAEPYDPFFNVNTPEELAEAERIAAEFNL